MKPSGPPARSPLVPFGPPKLKLPRVGSVADGDLRTPVADGQTTPRISFAAPKPSKLKGRPARNDKGIHVPKAQSGGMSLNDLRASRSALKKLNMYKHAVLFLQPVDPVRDHAPKFVARVLIFASIN